VQEDVRSLSARTEEETMKKERTAVQKFAAILFEEFEKDDWGDIDPTLFGLVADGKEREEGIDDDENDPEAQEEAFALRGVLERAVARLNPCPNCTLQAPCKEHGK
jgi:hypothetical protein